MTTAHLLVRAAAALALAGWLLAPPGGAPQALAGEAPAAPAKSPEGPFGFLRGLKLGAGLATSYTFNFNEPASRANRLRSFDAESDSFELDLLQLSLEKPAEPVGFRVDVDFGKIAQILGSVTRDPFGRLSPDEVEVQQAYISLAPPRVTGLTVKAGKFNTLVGAEVIEPWNNPTFSRGVVFGAQPTTNTGVRAAYAFGSAATATLGVVNGWDNVSDNNRGKTLEGQVTATPLDALAIGLTGYYGAELDNRNGPKRTLGDLVVTFKPLPPFTATLNYDAGYDEELAGVANAFWHGVALTLHYDLTSRLGLTARGEVFDDHRGVKFAGFGAPGRSITLYSGTATMAYRVLGPAELRLEYRHDGTNRSGFDREQSVGTARNQDTIAAALLVSF